MPVPDFQYRNSENKDKFQFTWLPKFQENKPFTTKLAYMYSVIFLFKIWERTT